MVNNDRVEREQAWTGDAVLCLFSRKWIMDKEKKMDAEMHSRMTSNNFLNCLGNPTKVEAEIGRIFNEQGLIIAFKHIEQKLLPLFLQQERRRIRQSRGKL